MCLNILFDRYTKTEADTLEYFAELAISEKNWPEAQALLKEATAIRHKIEGEKHPAMVTLWRLWGDFYRAQEHFEMAQEAYEQAITIGKFTLDTNHPTMTQIITLLSTIQIQ
ncbi:MAG TPA: tetratricopeptide repeat protein [Anaerolineae bacterium]|nr:tetratricopeptide repeat protein [Anaerolineae bacterium]